MTVPEIKKAVLELSREEKQQFILETLPALSEEVMQDRSFMMQLVPVMMDMVQKSGVDMNQLLQMAAMMSGSRSGS